MKNVEFSSKPKQIAASANCLVGPGAILNIFVTAASSTPTITVYDDAGTGTTTKIIDTFTPTAGQNYPVGFNVSNGVYVVISGTVSCTVGVQAS